MRKLILGSALIFGAVTGAISATKKPLSTADYKDMVFGIAVWASKDYTITRSANNVILTRFDRKEANALIEHMTQESFNEDSSDAQLKAKFGKDVHPTVVQIDGHSAKKVAGPVVIAPKDQLYMIAYFVEANGHYYQLSYIADRSIANTYRAPVEKMLESVRFLKTPETPQAAQTH